MRQPVPRSEGVPTRYVLAAAFSLVHLRNERRHMAGIREEVIPFPAQYESDVVLRDGSTLRLRPVRPGDAEALLALHDRLSQQSQRFRFFGLATSRAGEVARLLRADHDNEFVLVAEAGNRLIGAATYVRDSTQTDRAEVGFAIADELQGRGVGTRMLEMLAAIARDHHIATFDAYVMVDNDRMMSVFTDSGFEVQRRLEGGIFHVVLSLAPTARYEDRAAARSQAAATASMESFFAPKTVAVIGSTSLPYSFVPKWGLLHRSPFIQGCLIGAHINR